MHSKSSLDLKILTLMSIGFYVNAPAAENTKHAQMRDGIQGVCEQLYSKTTERIYMKFGVWLQHAIGKKRLTFGGDLNPDLDSAAGFISKK